MWILIFTTGIGCPIMIGPLGVWNLYANVTIMGQMYLV